MGFNPSISGISQVLNTLQKMTETRQPGMDSGMPNLLQAGMGTGQDFSKTLAALSESMELSLVNQALELGSGGSDKNSDGFFGGGMGGMSLDKMQMNMLMTTLNQMQQASQPQAAAQQAAQVSASGETDSQKNDSRNPGQSMTQTTGAGAQGVGEILGELSRYFESGTDGVGAIGFDRMGGTSYGMFQLSSAQGVVKDFINFLSDKNPEWASRLATAGPANTGSTSGGMPDAWREIAKSAPQAFEKLQSEFVQGSHYQPATEECPGFPWRGRGNHSPGRQGSAFFHGHPAWSGRRLVHLREGPGHARQS